MRRRLTPKISAASWAFAAFPLERPDPQADTDGPGLGTTRWSRPGLAPSCQYELYRKTPSAAASRHRAGAVTAGPRLQSSFVRSVRSAISRNVSGLRRKSRGRRISVCTDSVAAAGLSISLISMTYNLARKSPTWRAGLSNRGGKYMQHSPRALISQAPGNFFQKEDVDFSELVTLLLRPTVDSAEGMSSGGIGVFLQVDCRAPHQPSERAGRLPLDEYRHANFSLPATHGLRYKPPVQLRSMSCA